MTIRFEAVSAAPVATANLNVKTPLALPVRRRPTSYEKYGKRALDVLLVLLALPAIVPVIAIVALVIKLSGDKAFYSQPRIGRNGKSFKLFKLRSMIPNADQVLKDYLADNPEAQAEWDLKQKLTNDPRVTPIGAFIRKTSLDELPQLFNVLKGDMSLVGPRPMMPEQKALYPGKAYTLMRPGITCTWQVSDRNESSFAARAVFDTDYYEAISLKQDVSLLMRTVAVVLRGTGC